MTERRTSDWKKRIDEPESLQMRTIFNITSPDGRQTGFCVRVLSLWLLLLGGCGIGDREAADALRQQEAIRFSAVVDGSGGLTTRANNTTYNVTAEFYGDCDFYMTAEGTDDNGIYNERSSVYEIPSGSSGTIVPKSLDGTNRAEALTWFSRTEMHNFRGWAARRDFYDNTATRVSDDEITIEFKGSTLAETTSSKADTWKTGTEVWRNGEVLEPLIGARTDPMIYNEDGMYVPLRFRHLVSKIFLKSFYIVDNAAGSMDNTIKGHITFYGMPSEATLFTNPVNEDGEHIAPRVVKPEGWDYNPLASVTYAITNTSRLYKWEGYSDDGSSQTALDCWYICPELDFNQLSFKIELYEYKSGEWVLSPTHGKHGAYYGDFTNVTFARSTNGANYDDENGGDEKILHAGEYLILSITMSEKGNPGVKGELVAWSSASRTGSSHVYPGIYSLEDLRYMSNIMTSTTGTDEDRETYYELFGTGEDTRSDDKDIYPQYKDKDGNEVDLKIFKLYDDIGSYSYTDSYGSSRVDKAEHLRVADGYILDGQGHTVNFYCPAGSSISVGNVRNVYLRGFHYDSKVYSEQMVYIDNMGKVWRVDTVTFEMTATTYNLNDFTKNPVSITLSTGRVS